LNSTNKVLVTGADGFIGSHVVEKLVAAGSDVIAIAYYNSFNSWGWLDTLDKQVLGQITVLSGDVRDPVFVRHAMRGCDTVLHLAALIGIPYSYISPESYLDTNIRGTLNIVQAARDLDVDKVVCTSTSEVYGSAEFVPITEDHPLKGQSPYSATKIGADQMALSYYRSFETPVAIARPFNTYGPRQSARAVIPTIISQIANGQTEIKLGATTPTRDFSYVTDTAEGLIAIAQNDKSVGEVINLGSGFEISIGETVKLIGEVMDCEVTIISDDARIRPEASEVERLWAATNKAEVLLGWRPEYGGLEGLRLGLEKTAGWFSQPENLKAYKSDIYNV
jgi:NAD dependent epimerase/dehydratase